MADEKKETKGSESEHINLKVLGQDNAVVQFKIKKHTPLRKLMNAYCDRAGLSMQVVRFRFDGQPINENDTPTSLEMEEGDTIEVYQQQTDTRSPDRRNANKNNGRRREFSQRNRSRSRSRSRDRSRDRRRRHSRSRSRERGHSFGRGGSQDVYTDEDYGNNHHNQQHCDRNNYRGDRRNRDVDYRDRRDRHYRRDQSHDSYLDDANSNDSFESDQVNYRNQTPSNKIIILGLAQHITENDINNDLIHYGLQSVSIRLIRKRKTGTSRGFAFVEFNTQEEATRWIEYKQGVLMMQDQYRAVMQYSIVRDTSSRDKMLTDWYCGKCGVLNFKRRDNCFKCHASREESEKGGEGSDEISSVLTKKILLRNLDVLTNEEGVLTIMQEVIPDHVVKISKILISRDPLTSTSRGICYLTFDNLVDSMNAFNALKAIDPPLSIESREVVITYCMDGETNNAGNSHLDSRSTSYAGPSGASDSSALGQHGKKYHKSNAAGAANAHHYTLADVPRLAEYSANVYASTTAEHDHYYAYYTDYYVKEINLGNFAGLPTISQIGETANSGAAVALSAIQRKQKLQHKDSNKQQSVAAVSSRSAPHQPLIVPTGRDNKKYSTPDVSLYQYDEGSGYFYDPLTGLYYDPHSQYYYNNESCEYMYWNAELSTYLIAAQPKSDATSAQTPTSSAHNELAASDDRKDATSGRSKGAQPPQDKVKVAKKIVKDMEKWAKQLNQKKEMYHVPQMMTPADDPPATIAPAAASVSRNAVPTPRSAGYADVGFSILENKERSLDPAASMALVQSTTNARMSSQPKITQHHFESDSDCEQPPPSDEVTEKDYVAFDKLTCLLCKRAFPSGEVLQKHLRMSQLHKENLAKYNLSRSDGDDRSRPSSSTASAAAAAAAAAEAAAYRDRAKERRLKYGESDPPPVNKSRERWEKEVQQNASLQQTQTSKKLAAQPIGESNVGHRLLQKMGWSEGQGLGRKNQGRTNIIEAESRAPTAGLGTKSTAFIPGDDYKTYIKRMMKARYEQAED